MKRISFMSIMMFIILDGVWALSGWVQETPIYYIQHSNDEGLLPNCYPSDSLNTEQMVTGIVVGRYERADRHGNFFIQDANMPWSGMYIYSAPDTAQIGDSVTATGVIHEYWGETELTLVNSMIVHTTGNAVPNPLTLTCAAFNSLDSCNGDMEPYEGMLIEMHNVTITSSAGHGDFWANDGDSDSIIIMDDLSTGGVDSCVFVIGQTYSRIRGIGRYAFGQYRISPRFATDLFSTPADCIGDSIFNIQFTLNQGPDTTDCWPSPATGQLVEVCGVVTAVTQGISPRFYLQDQGNTLWAGIFCHDYTLPGGDPVDVHVGDYIQVTGRVHEYYGWTELDSLVDYTLFSADQPLPETTLVTVSTLSQICDFITEPYEDILVRINDVTVLSNNGMGEFWLSDNVSTDSIRMDDDLWAYGQDQPIPLPCTGAAYSWIVGVIRWEGREGGGHDRGWIILPRFASDYHIFIPPQPLVTEVWTSGSATLRVSFDRVMDPSTTENPTYYSTVNGLPIFAANLDSSGRVVYLNTGTQPNNCVDTLVTIGVCDTFGNCMIVPNRNVLFCGVQQLDFYQLDFISDTDTTIDSDWGQVDLIFRGVEPILYFNLIVDTIWAIENIPVFSLEGMDVLDTMTYSFPLCIGYPYPDTGFEIIQINYGFQLTDSALTSKPTDLTPRSVEVNNRIVEILSGEQGELIERPQIAVRLIGDQVTEQTNHYHRSFYNQDCPTKKACAPTAVSNSLLFLRRRHPNLNIQAVRLVIDSMKLATQWNPYGSPSDWWIHKRNHIRAREWPIITVNYSQNISVDQIIRDIDNGNVIEMGVEGHVACLIGIARLRNNRYSLVVADDSEQGIDGKGTVQETIIYDADTRRLSGGWWQGKTVTGIVVESPITICFYTPGDMNGIGGPNGIDVVYGVNFLKGGMPPTAECNPPCLTYLNPNPPYGQLPLADPFYAAMDVNGNCMANGIDITYFVSFLKGVQPALLHCPECPPAVR